MRFPTVHKFLKWFGPYLLGGLVTLVATFAAVAQAYPDVRDWGLETYGRVAPVLNDPWLRFLVIALAGIYVWALIYSGRETPVDEAASEGMTAAEPQSKNRRWIPLNDALRYLVYESSWSEKQLAPSTKHEFDRTVGNEFMERLARGEIKSRGKYGWEDAAVVQRTTETIPADYWTRAFLLPHDQIALADVEHDTVGQPGVKGYRYVIVDQNDVETAWPRRSEGDDLTLLAQFCDPLCRKLELERQSKVHSLPRTCNSDRT